MKIANQFVSNVMLDPAEKYSEENRAWQGVPSIARTKGGRLYVAFMTGGIYEPDPRNSGLVVYSDDEGDTWSDPILAIESKPEGRLRSTDPEFWLAPDGALWLFWAEVPYEAGLAMPDYAQQMDMENDSEYHRLEAQVKTYASVCLDPDAEEAVWSEQRFLFNGYMRNHPFATDSGRWLFPTWLTPPRDYYEFHYSDDQGKSFHTTRPCQGRPGGRNYDEPNFYRMADGRIAALVRTTGPHCLRMISADDGLTWSEPEVFMETSSQRPCCGNDLDGSVWMIPSIHRKSRNGLRLMHSKDGVDFEDRLILDDRERVSYPEFVQGLDRTLYLVYDRGRNNKYRKSWVTGLSESPKEILFARVPAAALDRGEVTPDTVRARVITKARIDSLHNKFTEE